MKFEIPAVLRAELREAFALTRQLKAELPAMFDAHRQIELALEKLRTAASLFFAPNTE